MVLSILSIPPVGDFPLQNRGLRASSASRSGRLWEYVMLNLFGFAPRSFRSGTSQAKLREASRFFYITGTTCQERDSSLPAVAQNDIDEEVVISSEL